MHWWSGSVHALSPPAAPTGLTASPTRSTEIRLEWDEPLTNPENIRVERSPNGTSSWTTVATGPFPQNLHVDSGLDVKTQYFYRVIAFDSGGESASSVANATTLNAATLAITEGGCWGGAEPHTLVVTLAVGTIAEVEDQDQNEVVGNTWILSLPTGTYTWTAIPRSGAGVGTAMEVISAREGSLVVCPIEVTVRKILSSAALAT